MRPIVILLALAVAVSHADIVKFKDCGSVTGSIVSVDITPCPKLPCQLKQGTKAKVKVTYKAAGGTQSVQAIVHGKLAGIFVPFPLPDSNACNTMSPKCPIVNGEQYVYTNELDVKAVYPKVSVIVKWELRDSAGKDLICFELPARIV